MLSFTGGLKVFVALEPAFPLRLLGGGPTALDGPIASA
jgi:hypothetical protein